MSENFMPNIVGFLCNWCSYGGADRAGSSKLDIAPSISVIRVMCSSRVDPSLVLNSLLWGADGVLVAGCHPGDCHYKEGNYFTRRRFAQLMTVLESFQIEPERVELAWVSASEGPRYAEVVNKFTDKIKALGPNPVKETVY
jgi:F420-non-reducing hydrogenase iron-sulfur subunit